MGARAATYSSGAVKAICTKLDEIRKAILISGGGSGGGVSENVLNRIENLESAVVGINNKLQVVTGEGDTTANIDTVPEIVQFLAGLTNEDRFKKQVEGTLDENGIIHYS